MHAYRLLGHEAALTLAGKNLRYLRRYFFRDDGSFLREPGDDMTVHFHEHSALTLYQLWKSIVSADAGRLRVNLLMNHASRWADVDSFLPYQGRIEVRPKQDADLDIRIPEWVAPGDAACAVNGVRRDLAWDGRYARVGQISASGRVSLTFPIGERTDVVYVEKHRYVLTRPGKRRGRHRSAGPLLPPLPAAPLPRRRAPPAPGHPLRQQRERRLVVRYDLC